MGMDYVGKKPATTKGEHLHLNWTGHRILCSLLAQLDCDMEGWSGTNNGDRLRKRVCQGFSLAIRKALAGNCLVDVKTDWCDDVTVTRQWAVANDKESCPISDEHRELWIGVAEFFEHCGGCEQW